MDNSQQQQHDRWFLRYKVRSDASFEDYQKIIEANNFLMGKIMSGVDYSTNRLFNEAIKEFDLGINKGEQLLSDDNLIDASELAKTYMNRGIAYEHLGNGEQSICDKRKSVEMLEELRDSGHPYDIYLLAMAYMNRGATYDAMGNYRMAIEDGEKSKGILEQLKQEGREVSSDYAMVLANIGMAKSKLKTTSDEMEELNNAIKEAKEMGDEATSASILTMRGLNCLQTGDCLKAISHFDEAIKMMEGFDRRQLDQNEMAKAYTGRGMAYHVIRKFDESGQDLNDGIKIWECLKDAGQDVDENMLSLANCVRENILAHTYFCKGVSFDQNEKFLEANQYYDKAIEIWERLQKEEIEIEYSEFAKAYMNRGANYYDPIRNIKKALEDYHKCINIIEQLQRDLIEQDAFDMVMAYKNRGRAYEVDGNMKAAINDNLTALRIVKKEFSVQPELQVEYYVTLIEIMELIVKENDKERFNNVIEEFLYSMRHVPKTAEAEEIQNNILEQLE